jgi:hypothetical protein
MQRDIAATAPALQIATWIRAGAMSDTPHGTEAALRTDRLKNPAARFARQEELRCAKAPVLIPAEMGTILIAGRSARGEFSAAVETALHTRSLSRRPSFRREKAA